MLRPELLTTLVLFVCVHALASRGVIHVGEQSGTQSGTVTRRPGTVTQRPGIVTHRQKTVTDRPGIVTHRQGIVTDSPGTVTDTTGTVIYIQETVTDRQKSRQRTDSVTDRRTDKQTDRQAASPLDTDSMVTGYNHRHPSFRPQFDRTHSSPADPQPHPALHLTHPDPHIAQPSTHHTHPVPHPEQLSAHHNHATPHPEQPPTHHTHTVPNPEQPPTHHTHPAPHLAQPSIHHTHVVPYSEQLSAHHSPLHKRSTEDSVPPFEIKLAKDSNYHIQQYMYAHSPDSKHNNHHSRLAKESNHHIKQYQYTQVPDSKDNSHYMEQYEYTPAPDNKQQQASPTTDSWATEESRTVEPVALFNVATHTNTNPSNDVTTDTNTDASYALTDDTNTSDKFQPVTKVTLKRGSAVTSSDDVSSLSSLLRDSFLSQNPSLTSRQVTAGSSEDQAVLSLLPSPSIPGWLDHGAAPASPETGGLWGRPQDAHTNTGNGPAEGPGSEPGVKGDSAISVEQRSWRCSLPDVLVGDEELPWTCHQHFAWRHLGEHVYPSRMYEAVCEGRTCWYGHFNCTPITYTLHVLQVCLRGCQDQRVPSPLRSRWQWTDLNITVGCQCVR